MSRLPAPEVPPKLRELLSDYPEYVARLQEALNEFAVPKLRLQPFDDALWALEDILSGFVSEATAELRAARDGGDPERVARANAKRELMFLAYSKNGGMRVGLMDDLWNYFEKNRDMFE